MRCCFGLLPRSGRRAAGPARSRADAEVPGACARLACPPRQHRRRLHVPLPLSLSQALLRVALQVHGDTVMQHEELREAAQRTQQRLAATWRRLDGLLQSCRCMVGLLGNIQA